MKEMIETWICEFLDPQKNHGEVDRKKKRKPKIELIKETKTSNSEI
jgi:hypothetical protein